MTIGIQWPLVLFTLIAGAGSGLLATCGLVALTSKQDKKTTQLSLIIAIVLLGVGGLMSVFHLSHPERFMAALTNVFSFSGIALELIGLVLSGVAAVLLLAFASAENRAGIKVLAVCAIIFGIVSTVLQGYAYFEVDAQPGWHTLTLLFSYMFTSLTSGALLFALIAAIKSNEDDTLRLIGKVALGLAILACIAIVAYVVTLASAGLLEGSVLVVAVVTIVCELAALGLTAYFVLKKTSTSLIAVAAVCAIGGGLLVRILMWLVATYGVNFIWEAAVNRGLYLL